MRNSLICAVGLTAVAMMAVALSQASAAVAEPHMAAERYGWTDLVRRDDFDGAELSTSWAVYDGPGHADNGIRSPEQVTVGNGVVRITGAPDGTTARHGVAAGAAARPLEAPARFPSRLTSPRRQDPRSRPECA